MKELGTTGSKYTIHSFPPVDLMRLQGVASNVSWPAPP